jgi:flagellin
MSIGVGGRKISLKINRHIASTQRERESAVEKLASGKNFSQLDPRPAEKALSDRMDFRLRGLAASKRNINDAVAMLQTAESGLSEINNIIMRMKELNVSAATTTISGRERKYLFIEYQALHDELNRIAMTTEYNGLPILNGESPKVPRELVFRIDAPTAEKDHKEDLNVIRFDGLRNIVATAKGLGLQSAEHFLTKRKYRDGIDLSDVQKQMRPKSNQYGTVFDEALDKLSTQRAVFGALQSRLNTSLNFIEVYQENISAAKSNMSDANYAQEILKVTESNILLNAATGLLAQSNMDGQLTANLINSILR